MALTDRKIQRLRISVVPYDSGSMLVWATAYLAGEGRFAPPTSMRLTGLYDVRHQGDVAELLGQALELLRRA